jgi:hypothetical protein
MYCVWWQSKCVRYEDFVVGVRIVFRAENEGDFYSEKLATMCNITKCRSPWDHDLKLRSNLTHNVFQGLPTVWQQVPTCPRNCFRMPAKTLSYAVDGIRSIFILYCMWDRIYNMQKCLYYIYVRPLILKKVFKCAQVSFVKTYVTSFELKYYSCPHTKIFGDPGLLFHARVFWITTHLAMKITEMQFNCALLFTMVLLLYSQM